MKKTRLAISSISFSRSQELRKSLENLPVEIFANEAGKKLDEEGLISFLKETHAEVLIIGLEPFTKRVIEECPHIKAVCKYGVGLDNIDFEAARKARIELAWTPGVNKRSVSELVLAFALGHCRNVFTSMDSMKRGQWVKNGGRQLSEKTVGIVGFGYIGQDLASLLQAFSCKLLVSDLLDLKKEAAAVGAEQVSYEELVRQSDILSFHVPLTALTRNLYSAEQIKQSKKDALIINTSRGSVVDFHAVTSGVINGVLGAFATDVYPEEPFDASVYKDIPGLYFTPHIGGNAAEAVRAMGQAAIDHLVRYIHKRR